MYECIANALANREALLDLLEKDNRGNLREVTSRCDEFFAEVSRWQVLHEAYLAPLIKGASVSAKVVMEDKVSGLRLPRPEPPLLIIF